MFHTPHTHTHATDHKRSAFDTELHVAVLENVNLNGLNEGMCLDIVRAATDTEPARTSISSKTVPQLWIAFDTRRQRDEALSITWENHFTPLNGSKIFPRAGRKNPTTSESQIPQLVSIINSLTHQVSHLTKKVEFLTQKVETLSSKFIPAPITNNNFGPQTHNYFCSHPPQPPVNPPQEPTNTNKSYTPPAEEDTKLQKKTVGKISFFSVVPSTTPSSPISTSSKKSPHPHQTHVPSLPRPPALPNDPFSSSTPARRAIDKFFSERSTFMSDLEPTPHIPAQPSSPNQSTSQSDFMSNDPLEGFGTPSAEHNAQFLTQIAEWQKNSQPSQESSTSQVLLPLFNDPKASGVG